MIHEQQLAAAVGTEAARELRGAFNAMRHYLDQLTDEQLWQRAADDRNSIGNLMLHLSGNVRQWIVAGIGGAGDIRDRPAEFAERGPISKDVLLARLVEVIGEAEAVLAAVTPADLVRVRAIQGYEVTGLRAIFSSVTHFRGHTQEIVHMTRDFLGGAYRFLPHRDAPKKSSMLERR